MEILSRHKRAFLITGIAICILAIILTVNPAVGPTVFERGLSYIVVPMQRGLSSAVAWVQGNFTAMSNNQRLLAELQDLRAEVSELRLANHRLMLAYEENYHLTTVLNIYQRHASLPTIGARVIGQDPVDWYRSFHIDRGSSNNVAMYMAVLGDGGLIGSVRQVLPGRSQVVSVIDHRFSAAVISTRTGDVGSISGEVSLMQQGLTRMNHIDAAAQIMPGDEIITSPDSTIFPPDLPVGTVVSIHTNPDGLTRYAIIEPFANLSNLEMVLVVLDED